MSVRLVRRYRFSAAHRYHRPDWSEEVNRSRFGACANEHGHGHNYRLTVEVRGEPDPETGFVVDLGVLDRVVGRDILDRIDHRHLNHAIEEFRPGGRIPSSENLVLWIRDRLLAALPPGATLTELRLAEDDDLSARWLAGDAVP